MKQILAAEENLIMIMISVMCIKRGIGKKEGKRSTVGGREGGRERDY